MNHSSESSSEEITKKYTCKNYMDKYEQYYNLACQLLEQAQPIEQCGQIILKASNLKENEIDD